jgi:hypothetical protein
MEMLMARTYRMKDNDPDDTEYMDRKGDKTAMDFSPRNLKNLLKRLKMDDFTGGSQLDDIIKRQRKLKKDMKGKA